MRAEDHLERVLMSFCRYGELVQMVERSLRMREVLGSIPGFSKQFHSFSIAKIIQKIETNRKILMHIPYLNEMKCLAQLLDVIMTTKFSLVDLQVQNDSF